MKEKNHVRGKMNSKNKMFISEINIIVLICQKLEWVRLIQQEIKLPSP